MHLWTLGVSLKMSDRYYDEMPEVFYKDYVLCESAGEGKGG